MSCSSPGRRQRRGILGGSFDPVHIGHLIMAQDALEKFDLQAVCFIPCALPPHKRSAVLAPAQHRLAMLEEALRGDPRFSVSTVEIERGTVSYTIDTIHELRRCHPHVDWFFIIGGDTLLQLHTWKEIGELLNLCRFVTVMRPGYDTDILTAENMRLPPETVRESKKRLITGHGVEVSSTEIRRRRAGGLSVKYLVPHPVESYINEHKLYEGRKKE